MLYPCPACGFEVFNEAAGSYDICPVCGWEDDDVQLRFPALRGGANKESLVEWQERVVRQLPLNMAAHKGYCRCLDWRPLTQAESSDTRRMPTNGREYFDAIDAEEPRYYWRRQRGSGRAADIGTASGDKES